MVLNLCRRFEKFTGSPLRQEVPNEVRKYLPALRERSVRDTERWG